MFDRPLTGDDYKRRTGPVYQLIWGRNMTALGVDQFLQAVGATTVVTGHQPQEMGSLVNTDHHLIVASEHNHGVYLPVSTDGTYTAGQLESRLQKFVAIE